MSEVAANVTEPLSRFAAEVCYDDLPPEVVEQARRFFLDAIGCALGAWKEDPRKARIAIEIANDFGSSGKASLLGGGQSHPALAALTNGILINAADNDDTHKRALAHIGSVVVPAALALTEERGGGGRELIEALVAGYEVTSRVGMAVMPTHYRFWHSTATNGTFGAAAAAGRAMNLSAHEMRAALGMAGTQAAGLNTFFESGDDTKSLHPGKAGLNGVLSAKLAAMGMTSPPDILGHPKGYLAAYSLEGSADAIGKGLGSEWTILDNGFKYYPSILASHSPIGASLEIADGYAPNAADITHVTVRTYSTVKSHFSSKTVDTTMAARLSVPYCVAIALVDSEVTQRQFQPDRFQNAEVRALLEKVEIIADDELTKLYPEKFPAQVSVAMADGTVHKAEVYYPKGDPSNPLSDEELIGKFRFNAEGVLGPGQTDELLGHIAQLSELPELAAMTAILRGARQPT